MKKAIHSICRSKWTGELMWVIDFKKPMSKRDAKEMARVNARFPVERDFIEGYFSDEEVFLRAQEIGLITEEDVKEIRQNIREWTEYERKWEKENGS